ncbi:hypothetical protein GOV10_02970 [Candidatus Woesearchaeota archaeon]|nr:hypothetical protein [Candidatus Woesearchaeota archaeon]
MREPIIQPTQKVCVITLQTRELKQSLDQTKNLKQAFYQVSRVTQNPHDMSEQTLKEQAYLNTDWLALGEALKAFQKKTMVFTTWMALFDNIPTYEPKTIEANGTISLQSAKDQTHTTITLNNMLTPEACVNHALGQIILQFNKEKRFTPCLS